MPKPKSKRRPPRAETGSSQERTVLIEAEQLDAYSIALFCSRHGISERFYFKLKAAGRGPAEMQLGNRVLSPARPPPAGAPSARPRARRANRDLHRAALLRSNAGADLERSSRGGRFLGLTCDAAQVAFPLLGD